MNLLNDIPLFREVILPILDILLLSYLLFKLYEILEETRAMHLIRGAVMLALIYTFAWVFRLSTLLWLLESLAPGLFIGLAIVFQPELRNIITHIGQREIFRGKTRRQLYQVEAVLNAVEVLADRRRGALAVFARNVGLKNIIDTGSRLNAEISSGLILTIFGYDGPLHDGAVIFGGGRLVSAGCFLPLSKQPDIKKSFGTRHRAALGLAEETDAVVLIVSEENGTMSLAYDASIFYDLDIEEIRRRLHRLLELTENSQVRSGIA